MNKTVSASWRESSAELLIYLCFREAPLSRAAARTLRSGTAPAKIHVRVVPRLALADPWKYRGSVPTPPQTKSHALNVYTGRANTAADERVGSDRGVRPCVRACVAAPPGRDVGAD